MTNARTTRRALLTSIMSLILCCTMLLGTTFAWFTDTVTSANNIITAGNLDVELYHTNKVDKEEKVGIETHLFDDIKLWEPGAVVYETFKIVNEGNLALKYQFAVNIANATKNAQGGTLADVLKVGVIEGGAESTEREDLIKEVADQASWQDFKSFAKNGELVENAKSDTYTVVIYWQPSDIDNEYNVDETKPLKIEIGVSLLATQLTAENDSFDKTYDENAGLYNVVVESEEALITALANAKNGDIIGIKGDVTWTTGAGIGSTPFNQAVQSRSVDTTDLNYITLQGVDENATFTAIGAGVGPVGIDNGTVIFKNLKIVDNSVSYAEDNWEYGYLEFRGNTVFENCDIVNAIMMEGTSATFKNCSFNSNKNSEYAVWISDGDASFENCSFTGPRGIKIHEKYGSEVGTVIIDNNTFIDLSEKPGLAIGTVNADTTVKLTNNMFVNTQPGDQSNHKYETDTVTTTFNFVDANNKVPEALTQVAGAPGIYADDNTAKTYYVFDKTGLMNLNDLFSQIRPGEGNINTVNLMADVDLSGEDWEPINSMWVTFNGNNHTISNLTAGMSADGRRSGFWAYAGAVTINDLTLENVNVSGSQAGAFVGAAEGTKINNCFLKGDNTVNFVAGIETYNGIGAISGVTTTSNINVKIVEGATVTLNKIGFTTDSGCVYVDNLTGYIQANNGTVENNGTLTLNQSVSTAEAFREVAAKATQNVVVTLDANITLGNENEVCDAVNFANADSVTIDGNNNSIIFKGKAGNKTDTSIERVAGILSAGKITVKNVTLVNDKLSYAGTETSADRIQVYTTIRGASVAYENVTFDGGVQVKGDETFKDCTFTENVLTTDENGYAKDGRFCIFIDHEYGTETHVITLEGCTFNASGYGCVKVAGDKGANITVNVKDCTFTNTCPSNYWSTEKPKYDIKKTGSRITVNDLGGNDWSDGGNAGIGEG